MAKDDQPKDQDQAPAPAPDAPLTADLLTPASQPPRSTDDPFEASYPAEQSPGSPPAEQTPVPTVPPPAPAVNPEPGPNVGATRTPDDEAAQQQP